VAGNPFPPIDRVEVDQDVLKNLTGTYRGDWTPSEGLAVEFTNGKLLFGRTDGQLEEPIAVSATEFHTTGFISKLTKLEFVKDEKGNTFGLRVFPHGSQKALLATLILDNPHLSVGDTRHSSFLKNGTHEYLVDAAESSFIFGVIDQLSVDVVVSILDKENKKVATFKSPKRGPQYFQFETKKAGLYKINVTPVEGETGDYEIALHRAEPIATKPADRVDQLMSRYDNPESPGGVVAVVEGGQIIFARAYGASNLTYNIPFEVDTRTNIGSTSKQFTAYAMLL